MDDPGWAQFSLPLVEVQCESAVLNEQLRWNMDSMGNLIEPAGVVEALNCPNLCSGNGRCNGNRCLCDQGYSFYDCSHFSGNIPTWIGKIIGLMFMFNLF